MERGAVEVRLAVPLGSDAHRLELGEDTQQLREDLLALDVDDVILRRAEVLPEGAKAGESLALGSFLVTTGPFKLTSTAVLTGRSQ
jgi:hypothetical protein